MKHAFPTMFLLVTACAAEPQKQLAPPLSTPMSPQLSSTECGVKLDKYLEMGLAQFDQRPEGWREIAAKPGCETAAADLAKQYRNWILAHIDTLIGHEAELRASAGDTANGLRLFREELAMQDDDEDSRINRLTNKATIAFLEGNRERLVEARNQLAALPQPPEFDAAVEAARVRTGRPDLQLPWPANLGMVDNLIRCFGKPYKLAFVYGCDETKAEAVESRNSPE